MILHACVCMEQLSSTALCLTEELRMRPQVSSANKPVMKR